MVDVYVSMPIIVYIQAVMMDRKELYLISDRLDIHCFSHNRCQDFEHNAIQGFDMSPVEHL